MVKLNSGKCTKRSHSFIHQVHQTHHVLQMGNCNHVLERIECDVWDPEYSLPLNPSKDENITL